MTGSLTTLESVIKISSPNSHSHSHSNSNSNENDPQRVLVLSISGQNVGLVPKNILNFFPNLIAINFVNIGLTTLVVGDLAPFTELIALRIINNHIESLSNDLMINNPKLTTFVFDNNFLKRVGAKLVNRWPAMNTLKLNNNVCVSGQSVNDPHQMIILLYNVGAFCAPTFETIEPDLLRSVTFQAAIDARITAKTNPIESDIDALQAQAATFVTKTQFLTLINQVSACLPTCPITHISP